MPKVYIDGKEYETEPGRNMLQVVLDNKLDLPYFCWHPAMGSVGACRQCAVRVYKDESDTKGKVEMACMTPAVEGTRISINDSEAIEFRRYIIEWLMVNHPHDCPVCDEGGECHLQDMTALNNHVYRRYHGKKRTYRNQDLGPFVNHEMNRCIQCYRCLRYYRDYAGGRDFNVYAWHNHIYFGRESDGVLESEFSGNLVEVCPTGVFTDKTLKRHYNRKWDLETAPSVCVHCGLGCNTIPGARYGEIRRIRARYNSDVNGYFLCDRGRYGYEFVNDKHRIRNCRTRVIGQEQISWDEAVRIAKEMLRDAKGVIGIGSPRASLEANYALKKLVGGNSFSTGLSAYDQEGADLALKILTQGVIRTPSLVECGVSDTILILGVDPTNESPMLDLSIRQGIRNASLDYTRNLKIPDWDAAAVEFTLQGMSGKLFAAVPWGIKLEGISTGVRHVSFQDTADLASQITRQLQSGDAGDDIASKAAEALKSARLPLVVTGISAGKDVIRAAYTIAEILHSSGRNCGLTITVPEANTLGSAMLGGMSVQDALKHIEDGDADTLIILENDLSRRMTRGEFNRLRSKVRAIIVLDYIEAAATEAADLVLPTQAYLESDGTFVNNEGRAQRFYQVFIQPGEGRMPWSVMQDIGLDSAWKTYEDVLRDMASGVPILSGALDAAPPADWKSPAGQKIAREPHRFSGRTAIYADRTMFEPRTPQDPNTPFNFSMDGDQNPVPGPLVPRFWWPGWNSPNSVTKFQQEVDGPLMGGNSGSRLIEPAGNSLDLPSEEQESTGEDEVWIVPRPCIFGSEELSRFSEGIAQLTPEPVISVNPDLAEKFGISDGQIAGFDVDGETIALPIRLDDSIPMDVAAVVANLNKTMGILSPVRSRLMRVS